MSLKGFTSCPNQILFDSSISINARLLFTQLNYWDRGNGSGCFARRDTISRMTGLSLYNLRNAIRELAEHNLITIKRRGQGKTDVIQVVNSRDEVDSNSVNTSYKEESPELELPTKPLEEVEQTETPEAVPNGFSASDDIEPKKEHQDIQETLQAGLQARLRDRSFYSWFRPGSWRIENINENEIVLRVTDKFIANWILQYYIPTIAQVAGVQKVRIINEGDVICHPSIL